MRAGFFSVMPNDVARAAPLAHLMLLRSGIMSNIELLRNRAIAYDVNLRVARERLAAAQREAARTWDVQPDEVSRGEISVATYEGAAAGTLFALREAEYDAAQAVAS